MKYSKQINDVVIVGAARTPIGSFLGSLSTVPATSLGATAIRAAVERSGVEPAAIQAANIGCVIHSGMKQAPARQAARAAGLPDSVPTVTTHKVCGSGLEAVVQTARAIAFGEIDIAVAGGMENMSLIPHLARGVRTGQKFGDLTLDDAMFHDGLLDPETGAHMGEWAELCAQEYEISREEQDAYATESYRRALEAQESGAFADEIVPVTVPGRKGDTVVDRDEEPGRSDPARFASLKPAFAKDGTVTAANASSINDGAAAVVLMSAEEADRRGAKVLGRITGWGYQAQEPKWFTTAPAGAIRNAAERVGIEVADVDLWEINEAFSVVALANMQMLDLKHDRVNVLGGAVGLGHPIGCSGTRLVVTLLTAMERNGAATGCASLCIGGGEGIAMMIDRPNGHVNGRMNGHG